MKKESIEMVESIFGEHSFENITSMMRDESYCQHSSQALIELIKKYKYNLY